MIREINHFIAECDECKHSIVYIGNKGDRKPPPLWHFEFAKPLNGDTIERTILLCPDCHEKEKLDNWLPIV